MRTKCMAFNTFYFVAVGLPTGRLSTGTTVSAVHCDISCMAIYLLHVLHKEQSYK